MDDAPPPPTADRPINVARNLVTSFGAQQIEAMIAALDEEIQVEGVGSRDRHCCFVSS
jgi:hypothetical protein